MMSNSIELVLECCLRVQNLSIHGYRMRSPRGSSFPLNKKTISGARPSDKELGKSWFSKPWKLVSRLFESSIHNTGHNSGSTPSRKELLVQECLKISPSLCERSTHSTCDNSISRPSLPSPHWALLYPSLGDGHPVCIRTDRTHMHTTLVRTIRRLVWGSASV